MECSKLYTVVTREQLNDLRKHGCLTPEIETWEQPLYEWMYSQMCNRLPSNVMQRANPFHFHYLFLDESDTEFATLHNWFVLELSIPNDSLLYFDDNEYVYITNALRNGHLTYIFDSEEDHKAHEFCSQDEATESWKKLFNPYRKRDNNYCGEVVLRAMTPYICKHMIVNIV